ncbi:hypothetical protein NE619_05960 [Anaerovorax odorimutans]|uniref:Uncharacterized protein n=1 Tax=Anaerovorax odorimutans TaxID=109327 RepID=A0ABT1RM67_9FIRM|nr:hypothetical protein [Anaerovorax odorimutans]MCQ4636267.1 hypothetical protein [Anaerovorax odorimutans]
MHIALRAESGRVTETVEYITKVKADYPVYNKGGQVYYEASLGFSEKGMLRRATKKISAHRYADNEASFIRTVDLARLKEQTDEK